MSVLKAIDKKYALIIAGALMTTGLLAYVANNQENVTKPEDSIEDQAFGFFATGDRIFRKVEHDLETGIQISPNITYRPGRVIYREENQSTVYGRILGEDQYVSFLDERTQGLRVSTFANFNLASYQAYICVTKYAEEQNQKCSNLRFTHEQARALTEYACNNAVKSQEDSFIEKFCPKHM